jgi:hypothetical protein
MRSRAIARAAIVACVLAVSGCSKPPATAPIAPGPPAVVKSVFQYDVRFTYADSGYTVRSVEYADSNGVVRQVQFQPPVWNQWLRLKPGDRVYLRAEVEFKSALAGAVQVVGPPGYYRGVKCERADGPATSILVIDELVK